VGVEPGKPVMIGIEYGGMTDEMRRSRNRQSGNSGIANEQVATGRIGGGRIVESGGASTPKKYTVWSLVQLAAAAK
jgi:hypothetical protein